MRALVLLLSIRAASPAGKQTISGIVRLLFTGIAKLFQKPAELALLMGIDLYTHKHTAIGGAVITVVKKTDVPALAHFGKK